MDVHELLRRSQSGTSATDVFCMVSLCRQCHDWVGQNPAQAVDDGWAVWRAQWEAEQEIIAEPYTGVYGAGVTERRIATFRISDAADKLVEDMAVRLGTSRTVILRSMLSTAARHLGEVETRVRDLEHAVTQMKAHD